MAKDFLPNHAKKANKNYSRLFKLSHKLKKFDVNSVSILEQILNQLDGKKDFQVIEQSKAFDSIFVECEKLKTLAFFFQHLKFR